MSMIYNGGGDGREDSCLDSWQAAQLGRSPSRNGTSALSEGKKFVFFWLWRWCVTSDGLAARASRIQGRGGRTDAAVVDVELMGKGQKKGWRGSERKREAHQKAKRDGWSQSHDGIPHAVWLAAHLLLSKSDTNPAACVCLLFLQVGMQMILASDMRRLRFVSGLEIFHSFPCWRSPFMDTEGPFYWFSFYLLLFFASSLSLSQLSRELWSAGLAIALGFALSDLRWGDVR
jgi:hypothetical protein